MSNRPIGFAQTQVLASIHKMLRSTLKSRWISSRQARSHHQAPNIEPSSRHLVQARAIFELSFRSSQDMLPFGRDGIRLELLIQIVHTPMVALTLGVSTEMPCLSCESTFSIDAGLKRWYYVHKV